MFNPATDAKEEGGPQKPLRRMPGRGVLDGIKQDLKVGRTFILLAAHDLACSAAGPGCSAAGLDCRHPLRKYSCFGNPPLDAAAGGQGAESRTPHPPRQPCAHTYVPGSQCACLAPIYKKQSLPLLQAAKESGDSYDPRGTGAAWTHNFLNSELSGICRRLLFSCTVLAGSVTDAS